ncbi:hypothetical protein Scep_012142 [Stephania cephalantha]|uniref:Retrotransposon gag domain-containing protein n=1 Tax=Stephania cephalantha TaxID=152367 RepID=A0AAP0JEK1_9MAGN
MSQLVTSHGQQLQEILRLLKAQAIPSPSTSAAPVTQGRSAPIVQDTITVPTSPTRPVIDEGAQVQVERVPPTPDTPKEDTPSMPTDVSIRATTEVRQSREFQRHHPEKFHGGTDLGVAEKFMRSHEIRDVLATPDHMRPSISSASLFEEADVWWRSMVATKGKPKDWAEFKGRFNQKYFLHSVRNMKRTSFRIFDRLLARE